MSQCCGTCCCQRAGAETSVPARTHHTRMPWRARCVCAALVPVGKQAARRGMWGRLRPLRAACLPESPIMHAFGPGREEAYARGEGGQRAGHAGAARGHLSAPHALEQQPGRATAFLPFCASLRTHGTERQSARTPLPLASGARRRGMSPWPRGAAPPPWFALHDTPPAHAPTGFCATTGLWRARAPHSPLGRGCEHVAGTGRRAQARAWGPHGRAFCRTPPLRTTRVAAFDRTACSHTRCVGGGGARCGPCLRSPGHGHYEPCGPAPPTAHRPPSACRAARQRSHLATWVGSRPCEGTSAVRTRSPRSSSGTNTHPSHPLQEPGTRLLE